MYLWKVAPGCSRSVGTLLRFAAAGAPHRCPKFGSPGCLGNKGGGRPGQVVQTPSSTVGFVELFSRNLQLLYSSVVRYRLYSYVSDGLTRWLKVDDWFGYIICFFFWRICFLTSKTTCLSMFHILNHDERMKLNCHTYPTWAACYCARQQTYGRERREMLWIKWPLDGMSSLERDLRLRCIFEICIV